MIFCEHCHIGRLKNAHTTYLQPMGHEMLVFPHAPALVCDLCGVAHFDTLFVDIMEALISDRLDGEQDALLSRTWAATVRGDAFQPHKMM